MAFGYDTNGKSLCEIIQTAEFPSLPEKSHYETMLQIFAIVEIKMS